MATYYVYSGATGAANGSSWTDAYTTLGALFTGQAIAGGDVIRIASDHDNGSYAASTTFQFPEASQSTSLPVYLISTHRISGDPTAGAIEQTNGNFNLTFRARLYCYGVTFKAGSGTSQTLAGIYASGGLHDYTDQTFHDCTFIINSTNTAALPKLGSSGYGSFVTCKNCTFTFGATGQSILFSGGNVVLDNCAITGATLPTNVIKAEDLGKILIKNSDFSNCSNLITNNAANPITIDVWNSILPSTINNGSFNGRGKILCELHSCGTGDHTYYYAKITDEGVVSESVSVYLTAGGATTTDSDGSEIPYSLQMAASATGYKCHKTKPLESPWLFVPCFSTGSKTFSVKIAHTNVAALLDTEAWLEVEYMGGDASANTPMGDSATTFPVLSGTNLPDFMATGSSLTNTAEAWTGITSEITHTLSKTVTVDEQGWARVRVCLSKYNSTLYVNPDVAVT